MKKKIDIDKVESVDIYFVKKPRIVLRMANHSPDITIDENTLADHMDIGLPPVKDVDINNLREQVAEHIRTATMKIQTENWPYSMTAKTYALAKLESSEYRHRVEQALRVQGDQHVKHIHGATRLQYMIEAIKEILNG